VSASSFTYATNVTVADAVVFVKVLTAKLSVAAVDDYGEPIDIYVTEVGPGVRRGRLRTWRSSPACTTST
jgi:hypothetical protein